MIRSERITSLGLATFFAAALLGVWAPTSHAQPAASGPFYLIRYSGTATVEWTPFEINRAQYGARPDVVGYGHERIALSWVAEGNGDVSAPDFGLIFSSLEGSVHIDNEGAPLSIAPPPLVCDETLTQTLGALLHVRYFPAARFPDLTLRDVTGGSLPTPRTIAGRVQNSDVIVPDFPLAPLGAVVVQTDNDKPECAPNLAISDWTTSLILPDANETDTNEWALAELAPSPIAIDADSASYIFTHVQKSPYAGPLVNTTSSKYDALPNAVYKLLISSQVDVKRVAQD